MPSFARFRNMLLNKEALSYGVFGVLTTLVNFGIFEALFIAGMDYRPANLISLVAAVLFAYAVNKAFVFRSKTSKPIELASEFARFALARGGTMLIDWFGLVVLVSLMGTSEHIGKMITTVIVIVLNYFLGKFMVFRRETSKTTE